MNIDKDIKIFLSNEKMWMSYKKKKLIGIGENSYVFECKLMNDPHCQEELKVMNPSRKSEIGRIAIKIHSLRTDNGELILNTLNHPNIPKLIGHGSDPETNQMFCGLTLGKGGDLMSMIEQKLSTEEMFLPIFYQLVSTVNFIHKHGVIHRDIKPENIVFKDSSRTDIMLVDWQLATRFTQEGQQTQDCGTLQYCAPEILKSRPYTGPEIDIWALGVLAYATVLGFFPFGGESPKEKLRLFRKPISFPVQVSTEFASLVKSFLQINPKDRISLDKALQHPWFSLYRNSYTPPTDASVSAV